MRRWTVALALALTVSLPLLAQDGGGAPAAAQDPLRTAAEELLERLLTRDRRSFRLGELQVEVAVVPDYFMVVVAREVLRADGRTADQVKADLQRLADRGKKMIGKVGVRVRLTHEAGNRNFYAFSGGLDDHIRVNAAGNVALSVGAHEGTVAQAELTLFRPSLCPVFAAEGNCPPTMRRRVSRVAGPLWVEFVARRDLSPRAKELQVGVGGFMHFSGPGIAGDQVDFDNGASCVVEPSTPIAYPLPLTAHAVPAALAEVMPTLPE